MIDGKLLEQLAVPRTASPSTEDQVTERLRGEATTVERRHGWIVSAHPEIADGATEPTEEQKAAAKAEAEAALAEIRGGKSFEDVAKEQSDDVSKNVGGDLGFMNKDAQFYDDKLVETLFGLQPNQVSDVFEGTDGNYYIARVTDIVPQTENTGYEQEIRNANVSLPAFRNALKAEVIREAMETKLVDSRHEKPDAAAPRRRDLRRVRPVRRHAGRRGQRPPHPLLPQRRSPGRGHAAADDPAWATAEAEAKAAYDELVKDPSKFQEIAKAQSDDDGTKAGRRGARLHRPPVASTPRSRRPPSPRAWPRTRSWRRSSRRSAGTSSSSSSAGRRRRTGSARPSSSSPSGKDFAEVAKAYSEGPTKDQGGDMGWIARNQIDSVREAAIFNAQVGGLTPVVTIADGLYLYKILDEETRMPDADQVSAIEGGAFSNWYTARKNESTITREYQSTGADIPPVG